MRVMNTLFWALLRKLETTNHQNYIEVRGKFSVHALVQPFTEEVSLISLDTSMKTSSPIWTMLISVTGPEFMVLNVYTVLKRLFIIMSVPQAVASIIHLRSD